MAVEYNPNIAIAGLLANWDFDNIKSFNPAENLITYSEDTSNYNFIENASVTTNSITAPDGTLTADTLTSTTTGGSNTCYVQKFKSVVANAGTYTFSVYLKAGTSPTTLINMQLAGGTYQQSILTITWATNTISYSGGTGFIESAGNGWYRVGLTLTNNGTNTGAYPRIYVKDQGTSNVSGQTVYVWGWQLEIGPYMNVYTPVLTTSTVTRSTNIIDMISGYNMSDSYGNNAYYINSTSSFMQFTRSAAAPKDGGGATVGTSGSLTAANFLYNDHTWEIWFRIDNIQPGYSSYGNDPEEQYSALANYQGYHSGFQYTASVMYYYIWNGVSTLPTCAYWTVGTSGAQINQGTWYQMVVTRLGNVFTPYINGAPLGTGSTTVTSATGIGTTNNLWLGKTQNLAAGAGDYLYYSFCSVSNMKMYNRALAPSEIAQNFQALRGRFGI